MAHSAKILAFVTKYIKDCKGYERLLQKVKILTIGDGSCLAEYKIEEEMTNSVGTMHGGFSATLVDAISSYAIYSDPKHEVPSVSVDLHLTYIKGAKLGEEVLIDAKTLRAGKTLAFLTVDIRNKKTGDLLLTGAHTKYLMRPKKA